MKSNPTTTAGSMAALIERQRVSLAKCKALGFQVPLAASLLAELELTERLMASRRKSSARTPSGGLSNSQALSSAFLSFLAHDLKNHLQSLKLNLYTVRSTLAPAAAEDLAAFDEMEAGLGMMSLIAQDLLAASQLDDGEVRSHTEQYLVRHLLEEVAKTSAPIAQQWNVHLRISNLDLETLYIRCDWDHLFHAVANLVVEVVKVTRPRGTVTLSARRGSGVVRFAVATTAMRVQENDASPALSVRVSLSTALIEAHGGRLWTGRSVGKGKNFYFTVPRGVVALAKR